MPLTAEGARSPAHEGGFAHHLLRLLIVGVGAGLIAAVLLTVLQTRTTTPLILLAETHEVGTGHHGDLSGHAATTPATDEGSRLVGTAVANAAIGIAFGLILAVALAQLVPGGGARHGLAFGVAGFVAVALAPALGLPPALPGTAETPLEPRQLWWLCTVLSTLVALAVFWRAGRWRWLGVLPLVFPHLLGAPAPPLDSGAVPAALAARFVAASLVDSAVLWATLGLAAGWLHARTGRTASG